MNKFITFFCIVSILFFVTLHARADQTSIVYEENYTYPQTTSIENTNTYIGVASAIATAQHNFDYGTHDWQGSVGIGAYKDDTAVSFGLAKRFEKTLINISVGKDTMGGAVSWHF